MVFPDLSSTSGHYFQFYQHRGDQTSKTRPHILVIRYEPVAECRWQSSTGEVYCSPELVLGFEPYKVRCNTASVQYATRAFDTKLIVINFRHFNTGHIGKPGTGDLTGKCLYSVKVGASLFDVHVGKCKHAGYKVIDTHGFAVYTIEYSVFSPASMDIIGICNISIRIPFKHNPIESYFPDRQTCGIIRGLFGTGRCNRDIPSGSICEFAGVFNL